MRTHISNAYSAATRTNRELRFFPFSTGRPLFAVLAIAAAAIGMTILLFPPSPADYEPDREAYSESNVYEDINIVSWPIAKFYVENHTKPEDKERLTKLVEEIVSAYYGILEDADFISAENIEKCRKQFRMFGDIREKFSA